MADSDTQDTKAAAKAAKASAPKRYKNRTKVDQTVYLQTGEGVRVPVGGTVILDDKTAEKFFQFFELVNNEDGSPVAAK